MTRVAVIGLGRIGGGVVRSLARKGGFTIAAHDPLPEALSAVEGMVESASSPAAAAAGADVVLVAVFDDAQLRNALCGDAGILSASPRPGAVVVLSTVTSETISWAAGRARISGVDLVDCGVSGGRAIEHGSIAAMIGGSDAAVASVRPVIEGFATPVVHMGPLGTGMQAKLARNMIVFGCWYVASEAARVAEAAGIRLESLIEVSDAADRWSGGATGLLKRGLSDDPEVLELWRRTPEYAHKDLHSAVALAAALGVDVPGAILVEERFDTALDVGGTS